MNRNRKMKLQMFTVDPKTIKASDLAKVRDVDFTQRFEKGIGTLMKMLGVTRKLPKKAGEVLKVYKVTGTLENGIVAEGEVIPLSKYNTTYTPIGEAKLKKWRKTTTAEAISEKGYGQAVNDTNNKMLKDIQKGIQDSILIQSHYIPGQGTESLYVRINETHAGTEKDSIPWVSNMQPEVGKYYVEGDLLCKCIEKISGGARNNCRWNCRI